VEALEPAVVNALPGFKRRMQWFIDNRPELREHVQLLTTPDGTTRRLLSIVSREQLPRVLRFVLDEREFLSPHGIRAVSHYHAERPYVFSLGDAEHRVDYEPAESSSDLFGGNSNWRGPIWFPMNYLLIESLQKFHHFYGDTLTVPFPTGADQRLNLWDVAAEVSRRLTRIFLLDADGRRPVYGGTETFQRDPHWRDLVLFYEYFHGDNGAGLGASHQTGWTGLVAKLLQQSGE
jgi:Glycosyl hydrolase family 63 C-terminal domain